MSYQGHSNYETWAVSLWIDNDESMYRHRLALAQECIRDNDSKDAAVTAFADRLEEWVEDGKPELEGVYADLLNGALSEVDWRDLANTWMNE